MYNFQKTYKHHKTAYVTKGQKRDTFIWFEVLWAPKTKLVLFSQSYSKLISQFILLLIQVSAANHSHF
jgi:hypothetical protein